MKTLLPAAILFCGMLLAVESASAQTWTQTGAPTNNFWLSIVSSADGSKLAALAAVPVGGNSTFSAIYTSTNLGGTWTSNGLPNEPAGQHAFNFVILAGSANGMHLVAAQNKGYGLIDSSTNWGLSWANPTNYGDEFWSSAASSADGKSLVVSDDQNIIYFSTNSGGSWTRFGFPYYTDTGFYAALSAGGNSVVVVGNKPLVFPTNDWVVYSTTNFGTTWATNTPLAPPLSALASSADGSKLAALSGNGQIYTSADSGNIWLQQTNAPSLPWSAVVSSADGTKLVAVACNRATVPGPIYTSTDSGTTWTSNNAPIQVWTSVACSADGSKLFAASYTNGIWAAQMPPTPELNLVSSGNGLAFSWLVPSTNFVLQENSDLTTTNWLTLTNTPTLNLSNLNNEVVLSPSNSSGFFRLMAQ